MKVPKQSMSLFLALSFLFATATHAAALERRADDNGGADNARAQGDVVCASSEQKCSHPGRPSFCCPTAGMKCGEIGGQCVKISSSSTSKTTSTAAAAETNTQTAAAASQDAQTTPSPTTGDRDPSSTAGNRDPASTAAKSTGEPQPGVLEKIKKFFTPNTIIIFAASGGSAILLLAAISCFCYRKRKQGRLLLAAYENPNRDAYRSVILSNGKPAFGDSSSGSSVSGSGGVARDRDGGDNPLLPSAAKPAAPSERSPQPQYFDLYSPDSPAFQMTEQTPVGPLERHGNDRGSEAAAAMPEYHLADRQQQQQEQYYHQEDGWQQQQQHQQQGYYQYHDGYGAPGVAVGGPGGDTHASSPEDYAAGHIYTDYAAPQRPEDAYTGHHHHHHHNDQYHQQQVQTYPDPYLAQQQQQQQHIPDGWVPQHYRQATPPQHAYAAAPPPAQSPPRPRRGPDVYLPAELAGPHPGMMPHAV